MVSFRVRSDGLGLRRAAFQAAVGRMRGADDKRTGKKQTGKAAANKFSGCLNRLRQPEKRLNRLQDIQIGNAVIHLTRLFAFFPQGDFQAQVAGGFGLAQGFV